MFDDTIAAIATPLAKSAISIIRLSGPDSVQIADRLFSRDLSQAESHRVYYGKIMENGKPIDEVLLSVYLAPKTYTREDVVEINCHGGIFITRKILSLLLENGARLARPGEFTQRAFLNGRIDLTQAEAVESMIEASSMPAASKALADIDGSIGRLVSPLIDQLMDIIAAIEVNIDYPEYDDVEEMTLSSLLPASRKLYESMTNLLERSRAALSLSSGLKTVIAGKPNAGKSSLLNALLLEDKAIVTDIPGTTRDTVEGQIQLSNTLVNLIDTAGLRESDDKIEQIGIEKTRQQLEKADLILVVLDGSRPLEEEDMELLEQTKDRNRILVINKNDLDQVWTLPEEQQKEAVYISTVTPDLSQLKKALEKKAQAVSGPDNTVLANERQIGLLSQACGDMLQAIEAMEAETVVDLAEIDLKAAHDHLREIFGEVHREDLLDTLFSNFCLGK